MSHHQANLLTSTHWLLGLVPASAGGVSAGAPIFDVILGNHDFPSVQQASAGCHSRRGRRYHHSRNGSVHKRQDSLKLHALDMCRGCAGSLGTQRPHCASHVREQIDLV